MGQAPRVDAGGTPVNFLDVDVRSHLAFYRAGIAAITEEDPYAGLLVSMHGAGIYRQRYGLDPGLGLTRAAEAQDGGRRLRRRAGGEVRRRARASSRADYELLQLFDRLSLYFCMRDVEAGEAAEMQGYELEPVAPWHVRIDPYPFASGPARFSLVRRVIPKTATADVLGATPQTTAITIDEYRDAAEPDLRGLGAQPLSASASLPLEVVMARERAGLPGSLPPSPTCAGSARSGCGRRGPSAVRSRHGPRSGPDFRRLLALIPGEPAHGSISTTVRPSNQSSSSSSGPSAPGR